MSENPNELTKYDRAWLKRHRARMHRFYERHGEETWEWYQIVRGKFSLSGHPLPTAQQAIRKAKEMQR